MPSTTKKGGKRTSGLNPSPEYLKLLTQFPPRPIASKADLTATQAVIDALLDQGELRPEEQAYLNVLGALVYDYEQQHVPIPDISGVELLKVLIADFDLRQKDLVPIFKTESIVSDVLNGKRKLTVQHIKELAQFFHISPAVFF
jgi:HTH-type transcriptional regulator / antitoxin HigA